MQKPCLSQNSVIFNPCRYCCLSTESRENPRNPSELAMTTDKQVEIYCLSICSSLPIGFSTVERDCAIRARSNFTKPLVVRVWHRCSRCTESSFPCTWCVSRHRCSNNREECQSDTLITGRRVSDRVLVKWSSDDK